MQNRGILVNPPHDYRPTRRRFHHFYRRDNSERRFYVSTAAAIKAKHNKKKLGKPSPEGYTESAQEQLHKHAGTNQEWRE
jgi:hypothetical protein